MLSLRIIKSQSGLSRRWMTWQAWWLVL